MIGSVTLYLMLLYPLFNWVVANPSLTNLISMQVVLCSLLGAFFGPFSSAIAEQFPSGIRSTGMSVAYNIAVMLFGGLAQFIVTWLIKVTASPVAPVFYLIFAAAVGLLGAIFLVDPVLEQRRADEALHHLKKVEG